MHPTFAPLIATLFLTATWAAPQGPPRLPLWPHRKVAATRLPEGQYVVAELDGHAPQEVVGVVPRYPSGGDQPELRVYRWQGHAFQLVTRLRYEPTHFMRNLTAGDLDGDGKAELYVQGLNREVRICRLIRGQLHAHWTRLPGSGAIVSLGISDARRPGHPDLVATTDPRFTDDDGEPDGHLVVGFQRRGGAWRTLWSQSLPVRAMYLSPMTEARWPDGKPALGIHHSPSGIDSAALEGWRWRNGRLRRVYWDEEGPFPPHGMRIIAATSSRLRPGIATVLSHTGYFWKTGNGPGNSEELHRGELLEWRGSQLRARYRLPGEPLAVGEIRPGHTGLLVMNQQKRISLLEPRAGAAQR